MASGGNENAITGNVTSSVQAHTVYGGITFNYHAPPAPDAAPATPWARLVHGSKAWCDGHDRSAAVAVAEHLATLNPGLPEDPWLDRGLAERFTKRLSWLVGSKLEIELGPAEATLLTLIPLLHQVLWARAAADRLPDGPPESFYRDHSRLAARMDGHDEVRWWLFHRWLWLQAEVLKPESIADLLAGVAAPPVLTAERVSSLLQGLRIEPNVLCGKQRLVELRQRETLFGGTDDEQHIRTPLLGLVLAVAYGLAIDPTGLSDIIVWHTPVDFPRLRETIAEASWDFRADCPVLSAACHHASVVEALREHTVRLDALLHAVRQAADEHPVLAPLRALPERASSDDVRPAAGPDGKPVFSGWSRFRMDEQRVQELLMGEQLYRDRSLAIRELYQNALDACRYRRAREEYLRRTTDRAADWSGRIAFAQGVDEDGRPYLDCTDNGIGMGLSELTGVFARAGARFADLAEFRDEQVDWSRLDPPVELYPNSRFGIGVLSYFMLADEITITTCRMSRYGGRPGPAYQVEITGPGHLFEVKKLVEHGRPGTTVRLHLRADVRESCVKTLSRLLAIAEFDTTAQDDTAQAAWPAGVFEKRLHQEEFASGTTVASADGHVVWCEDKGGLLVDGLHVLAGAGPVHERHGCLVNLTGPLAPRLSVDRTTVLDNVGSRITELQAEAVPELVAANTLLTGNWLRDLGFHNPALADLITGKAPEHRCFPADEHLLTGRTEIKGNRVTGHPLDHIFLWRAMANNSTAELADVVPDIAETGPLLPPRPSDLRILCDVGSRWEWASIEDLRTPTHIVGAASATGATPRSVARRLTMLGVDGIDIDRFPDDRRRTYETDLAVLSLSRLGRRFGRPAADGVYLSGVAMAVESGMSMAGAMDILSAYGIQVVPSPDAGEQDHGSLAELVWFAADDMVELRDLTDEALPDWLDDMSWTLLDGITDFHAQVPLGHVLSRAKALDLPVEEVCRRLATLGLTTPDLPATVSVDDADLVSVNLDGNAPWLDIRRPVRLHHLIKAHAVLSQSPFWAADRLGQLGFTVQAENLPYYPEYRDLVLLRIEEFNGEFLDPDHPVPLSRLVTLSRQLRSPLNQIVDRLRELGMHEPDLATTIRTALAKVPLAR